VKFKRRLGQLRDTGRCEDVGLDSDSSSTEPLNLGDCVLGSAVTAVVVDNDISSCSG